MNQGSEVLVDRSGARSAGFTLLEMMIVTTVLAILLGAGSQVLLGSLGACSEQSVDLRIRQTGRRVVERICQRLPEADPTTMSPLILADSTTLSYQVVTGHDGSNPTYGDTIALWLAPGTGETANGVDDNGDGRIDEGVLWIQEGVQPATIIASDLTGVRFNSIAGGIDISVDVSILDRDAVVTRSFSATVAFRNPT
jgi:prepilin-type N-terminal cleavage/methylation domain-containing protein